MSKTRKKPKPLSSIGRKSVALERARAEIARIEDEAFQIYVEPLPDPTHLFHFSSLRSIRAILESKVLWASDLRQMNDKTELIYAEGVLREAAAETDYLESVSSRLADELRKLCPHIACLSLRLDQEAQWREYADRGTGAAISFGFHDLKKCSPEGVGSFPMAYERGIQIRFFKHVLANAAEIERRIHAGPDFHDEVLRTIGRLLLVTKNPTHAAECEWRLHVNHNDRRFKSVKRPDGVCCRELPICTPETISELFLGPDCAMDVAEGNELLSTLGYSKATARKISWGELL